MNLIKAMQSLRRLKCNKVEFLVISIIINLLLHNSTSIIEKIIGKILEKILDRILKQIEILSKKLKANTEIGDKINSKKVDK